jgi:hypothetical protein
MNFALGLIVGLAVGFVAGAIALYWFAAAIGAVWKGR